jgi:RHS repeat-associated protein
LSSSGNNYGVISNYINNIPYSYNQPKAAINWILFDEQLNYVTGSFDMVQYGGGYKLHTLNAPITKAGYLYIYASNESNLPVFFDNLGVTHTNGPVLELTDYYPFGLTMAGISSKTANSLENKKRYNGNELQNKEFNDGSGIEFYDFNARTYNQQVGRFLQIDPTPEDGEQESLTPYHFSGNNPATFNDPNGKCPWCWGAIIGAAVEYGTQVASNLAQGKSLGESLTDVKGGQILIAAVAGAASGGVSAFVPKGAVATVVKEAVVAGIGAAESAAKQYNATGKISGTKILTDVAANFVGDKLTKNIKVNSSSAIKTTEKQLDRATRIAANDATSSGRAATVKNLETKVSSMNATNKRVQATAAGAAGSTLQAGVDAAIENSTNSKPVAPPGYNINKPVVDNTAVKIIIPTHL